MDNLLQLVDTLLSGADETFIETHAETITQIRTEIGTAQTDYNSMVENSSLLAEQNITLKTDLTNSRKKYYDTFFNGTPPKEDEKEDDEKDDENVPLPLNDLLAKI